MGKIDLRDQGYFPLYLDADASLLHQDCPDLGPVLDNHYLHVAGCLLGSQDEEHSTATGRRRTGDGQP